MLNLSFFSTCIALKQSIRTSTRTILKGTLASEIRTAAITTRYRRGGRRSNSSPNDSLRLVHFRVCKGDEHRLLNFHFRSLHQKNADNGMFVKLTYNSEPYTEISEKYSKTQPLPDRKLGFGSHDASKTGEFTCWKTTERYRSMVKQENHLMESRRDGAKEKEVLQRIPRSAPLPPRDRDGKSLKMPMFMYDIGRSTDTWSRANNGVASYDPKSTRDCFYSLPKHAKGEIRRLGSDRPSSAVIGLYAWKHKYTRPEHGSSNRCQKFYDRGHL